MKNTLFIITIAFTLNCAAQSQTPMVTSGSGILNMTHGDADYIAAQKDKYATIDGTPYLNEAFEEGSLIYKRKLYTNFRLRYNVYEGYFEYETDDGIMYFDPHYTEVDTVWLAGEKYIFLAHEKGNTETSSYMSVKYKGINTVLLSWVETILIEAEEGDGYSAFKPARFDIRPEKFYVSINNNTAKELKNKKSISHAFPDHEKELLNFIKKEKIKFKKTEDLVALCKYYNSL